MCWFKGGVFTYGSASASNSFIVAPGLAPERDVVGAALRCGTSPESLQDDVHQSLWCQNVSSDNGRIIAGVQNRALGYYNPHWSQAALQQSEGSTSYIYCFFPCWICVARTFRIMELNRLSFHKEFLPVGGPPRLIFLWMEKTFEEIKTDKIIKLLWVAIFI